MANVPIEWAYHVTNIPATEPQPNWPWLHNGNAKIVRFSGPLTGLPCVFFSTSLCDGQLPTLSPYPIYGNPNTRYWRIRVPMSRFVGPYVDAWSCEGVVPPHVMLLLTRDEEHEQRNVRLRPHITAIDLKDNPYLRLEDGQWYSNDWNFTDEDGWITNFAVMHQFVIDDECQWDTVTRSDDGSGSPRHVSY